MKEWTPPEGDVPVETSFEVRPPAKDRPMARTILDIEKGKAPPATHWQGEPMGDDRPGKMYRASLQDGWKPPQGDLPMDGALLNPTGRQMSLGDKLEYYKSHTALGTPVNPDSLDDLGKSVIDAADMALSIPGAIMGVGADLGSRLLGVAASPWTGESAKDIAKAGLRTGQQVAEPFSNPIKKLMSLFGEKGEEASPSTVAKAMQKVNQLIEKGGEAVEEATGGKLNKEDVQSLANEVMALGPVALGAKGGKAPKRPEGEQKLYTLNPVEAVKELFQGKRPVEELKEGKPSEAPVENAHQTYVKSVENLIGQSINDLAAQQRLWHSEIVKVKEAAPELLQREAIAEALDRGTVKELPEELRPAAERIQERLQDIGERAKEAGVLDELRENYITHVVDWKKSNATLTQGLLEKLLGTARQGGSSSRFGKARKHETFDDLQAALQDSGLQLRTKDVAEILRVYSTSMERAIQNRNTLNNLKVKESLDGEKLIKQISEKEPMPRGWEIINAPGLRNWAVSPEIAPQVKFMFDQTEPGAFLKAAHGVSQLIKRVNVVGSLFHAKSLAEASWSALGPVKTVKDLSLAGVDKLAGTKYSGITKALEQFRKGEAGDMVDEAVRDGGLVLEIPEDVSRGILSDAGKVTDQLLGRFGPKAVRAERAMGAVEKVTLGVLDKFTWDFLHTGLKLNTFHTLLEKAVRDHPDVPRAQLAREVGIHVNRAFGGLNWYKEALTARTEFAKKLQLAAFSKNGRAALQVAMFAPDWTISTVRNFTGAFGKGSGVQGLLKPRYAADFMRRYQIRTALTYFTIINAINQAMSGHSLSKNKDPSRIEFRDGTSLQPMKHAAEPWHWMTNPSQTLANKLGFIPKAMITTLGGVEYASPVAPKMKDQSLAHKAGVVAKSALPFQVGSMVEAPPGEGLKRAVAGTLGFPVYGKAKTQTQLNALERIRDREERKRELQARKEAR